MSDRQIRLHPSLAALGGDAAEVVLLRHGEALGAGSLPGVGYDGQPLTPTGRAQARAAAEWITRTGPVDAVLASPLRRCRETAEPLVELIGRPEVVDVRLAELRTPMDDAAVTGTAEETVAALRAQAMALADAVGADGRLQPGDGLEPRAAFRARVAAALLDVAATHAGRRVVLVSHALWCASALALVTAAGSDVPCVTNHAGISILRIRDDGGCLLGSANSTAHVVAAGLPVTLI